MAVSSLREIIFSGQRGRGPRLLLGMTDGGGVTKKEATRFRSAQRDERPVLIKLSGEFDIRYQSTIEDTLRDCLASGRPALVDLSGVTFMDALCIRELAVHYQLGGGLMVLCDPSEDMEVSAAACDLEDWLDFVYTDGLGHSPNHSAAGVAHNAATETRKGVSS
jgi:anti-anti-sigma factor